MASEREEAVYLAKLSEQAERYDGTTINELYYIITQPSLEMVENMKKVATLDQELSVEERNLLSVAYKNVIGARRASWRIVSSIEQNEDSKGNAKNVDMIRGYKTKIEEELSKICSDILKVLDDHLIKNASAGESKVFYHKMKGDYYRYLAEFSSADKRSEASEKSLSAYKAASGTHSLLRNRSSQLILFLRCCRDRVAPNPPDSLGIGLELLGFLLRNHELPRSCLSACQAGFRRCHRRVGHPLRRLVQGFYPHHAVAA